MKREAPTEREITDLISSAYEGWAVPDPRRLAAIEQPLLEQPRRRGRTKFAWWWLVGALLAGAASALWWTVNYDSVGGQRAPVPGISSPSVAPSVAAPPTPSNRFKGAESNPAGEPTPKQGPVIYQRER